MSEAQKFQDELSNLVRARYALLSITTYEEARCLELIEQMCKARNSHCYVWSRTEGVVENGQAISDVVDPMGVLKWYEQSPKRSALILKDFHPYIKEPTLVRKLRDLNQNFKGVAKNLVFLGSQAITSPELTKEVSQLELPLPRKETIVQIVSRAVDCLEASVRPSEKEIESIAEAASGLTAEEIENAVAKSMVTSGKLDPLLVQTEKKQIVKKSGLLEFIQADQETQVGGLRSLRHWLRTRREGFSPEARSLGLPLPKGILMVGVPGCGKSLTAMAVGKEWQIPLLRLDMGKIFSGLVGSSESNVRRALATCEAVSPCILWIDEIEKGLAGASGGSSDGGTSSRVFGTVLTWMQEKKSPVFVLATANDISKLPPEFLRKGRFDEIFFVDLPNASEREEIIKIHLKRYDWEVPDLSLTPLIEKTKGFSGAELEQVLVAARYEAFSQKQPFKQSHLEQAVDDSIPLSKTMSDRLDSLRAWAQHRARSASPSKESVENRNSRTRSLELSEQNKSEKKEAIC